ncbi:MAG: hypothetical protein LBJ88_03905, partial [Campylobacteraceae bacterium]|nr:hypothetical protein [Campylobacteraceae bacterium]
ELAKTGNIQAQQSLAHLYKFGEISAYTGEVFVERNITKSEYWVKVAECTRQSRNNQKCLNIE